MGTHNYQESSLNLELFIDLLVFDGVVPQPLVETVALGCFNDMRGKDLEGKTLRFDRRDPSESKLLLTGSFACCVRFKT